LIILLLCNNALTFGDRQVSVQMSGRAPNLLIVQLVETMKKFSSLLLTALINAPPLPPIGFWGGSVMLILGTVQFLSSSDCTPDFQEEDVGKADKKEKNGDESDDFGESSSDDTDESDPKEKEGKSK